MTRACDLSAWVSALCDVLDPVQSVSLEFAPSSKDLSSAKYASAGFTGDDCSPSLVGVRQPYKCGATDRALVPRGSFGIFSEAERFRIPGKVHECESSAQIAGAVREFVDRLGSPDQEHG